MLYKKLLLKRLKQGDKILSEASAWEEILTLESSKGDCNITLQI